MAEDRPVKIHYAPNTRAVRVVWLCEELGLPYTLERYALGDPKMRGPEHLARHPLGRVPVLEDGATRLYESGAIVEYILARHGGGRLRPAPEDESFPHYLQWLHYAEGIIMPHVNVIVVETVFLPPERRNQVNVDRATKQLGRALAAVDAALARRDYLLGDFSGADIMTGHATIVAAGLGADLSAMTHLPGYVERLRARPALAASWDA
ncbi:MAG: glutathione S-transferase family protein [Pseudomonadota bacterium]